MRRRRDRKEGLTSLPLERKVLAERYTIDADEASRREEFSADEGDKRPAPEPKREERPVEATEKVTVAEPIQEEAAPQTTEDLPIYRWFGSS